MSQFEPTRLAVYWPLISAPVGQASYSIERMFTEIENFSDVKGIQKGHSCRCITFNHYPSVNYARTDTHTRETRASIS